MFRIVEETCWKQLFNSRAHSVPMPLYWLFGHTLPVRHCMWQNVLFSLSDKVSENLNLYFQLSKSGSQFGSRICQQALLHWSSGVVSGVDDQKEQNRHQARQTDDEAQPDCKVEGSWRQSWNIKLSVITLLRAVQRHQTVRIVMKLLSLSPLQWLFFAVMTQEGIYYHLLLCITQSTCHSRCCLLSLVFKSFPIRFITSSSRPQNHWVAKKCKSLHFLRRVCACLCNFIWASKQSSIFLLLCQCPSETRHASPINQVLVTIWLNLSLMWLNRRWKHGTPLIASILTTLTRNRIDIEKATSNTASTTVINDTVLMSVSDCQASPRLIPPASSAVLSAPH